MLFPVLSTGHFNKYERKCQWLGCILPISSVAVKVQCLREKGKTMTPSWKSQAKGEIACMTAVSLRLSCEKSLVMRSEKSRLYSLAKGATFTLKTGKIH